MLATDTYMHVRTYWLAKLDRHLHQLAHTGLIQFGKRIIFKNLGIIVSIQELTCIITGESIRHLSQIIRTKAEELSFLGNLVSRQSCSGNLDHGTNLILQVNICCCNFCVSSLNHKLLHIFQLFDISNQRNHNLRNNIPIRMSLLYINSSTNHSLSLHLSNLRISYRQTATTMTHHRVKLMQRIDHRLDMLHALALSICQLLDILFLCGNELMQRRI